MFLLASCQQPSSYEKFIRTADAVDGQFCFEIDMSDTLSLYDLSFFTRVDVGRFASQKARPYLELYVSWVSPSGQVFDETVFMEAGDSRGSSQLYRSGLEPFEAGEWKLNIRPVDAPSRFRGLGVICRKNGTR